MGCTSSNQTAVAKVNTSPVPTTSTTSHDGQQLIPDHFRKWLKTNRPKADEFVLNDVLSTAPPSNEAEDYRNIVGKALDLLADRHDIKSTNKLGKLLQKEISLASPKKVAHTVQILKQTADKLRDGQIQLESEGVAAVETTDEAAGATATDEVMRQKEIYLYSNQNQNDLFQLFRQQKQKQQEQIQKQLKFYQVNLVFLFVML